MLITSVSIAPIARGLVVGPMIFNCRIEFPTLPTSLGLATDCSGNATGLLNVTTTGGNRFNLLASQDDFLLHFSDYFAPCVGGLWTQIIGDGSLSVSGLETLNGSLTATVQASFTWISTLAEVAFVVRSGTVTLSNGQVADFSTNRRGDGVMIPLDPIPYPMCSQPGFDVPYRVMGEWGDVPPLG